MAVTRKVEKYSASQPRDERGRWTDGAGGGFSGTSPKAREVAARIGPTKELWHPGSKEATYTTPSGEAVRMIYTKFEPYEEGVMPAGESETMLSKGDAKYVIDVLTDGESQGDFRAIQWEEGDPYYIDWIGVGDPDYRRQGIATAMLEFARRESDAPIEHSGLYTTDGEPFAEVVKYNPSQPRDNAGRWTSGGSWSGGTFGSGSMEQAADGTIMEVTGQDSPILGTKRERKPLEHLYRAVSEEDWSNIQSQGFIQSDGRMNIEATEGTVATNRDPSFYLPTAVGEQGRVLRIDYDPADEWRIDPVDGYAKTPARIPIERISGVTEPVVGTGASWASPADPAFGRLLGSGFSNQMANLSHQSDLGRAVTDAIQAERKAQFAETGDLDFIDAGRLADAAEATLVTLPDFPGRGDMMATVEAVRQTMAIQKRYNPNQPRDSRGRWTNGASAGGFLPGLDPKSLPSVSPREALDSVLSAKRGDSDYAKKADLFEAALNSRIGKPFGREGLQAKVEAVIPGGRMPLVQVSGTIYTPEGEMVGRFERTFYRDSVVHTLLEIDSTEHQGTGFGTEFSAASEAMYTEMGMNSIRLQTGLSKGGYTWALAGYEFDWEAGNAIGDVPYLIQDAFERRWNGRQGGESGKADAKFIADTFGFDAEGDTDDTWGTIADEVYNSSPWQIANLRTPSGEHIGREIMEGAEWYGVKYLTESTFGKALTNREYVRLFDDFTRSRRLDLDDQYWTEEERAEWADILASSQVAKYNPRQPRDDFGRWTSGGFGHTRLAGVGDVSMAGQARAARARGNFYRIDGAEFTPEQIEAATTEGASLGQIDVAHMGGTAALLRGAEQAWQGTDKWNSHILKRTEETETVEGFKRVVEEELDAYFKGAETRIRVPKDKLSAIIADGHLKSTFENKARLEVSTSAFMSPDNYHGFRAILESEFYGIPLGTGNAERHPIYGALEPKGLDFAGRLEGYGDVTLTLKPGTTGRTTFTFGDSFTSELTVPTLVDSPGHQSVDPYRLMEAAMGNGAEVLDRGAIRGAINSILDTEYIEAQIHGGVTLDDIATVGFTYPYPRGIEEVNAAGLTVVSQGKTYAPVDKRYNPGQPRDSKGRWTDGVGGGGATVQVSPSLMLGGNRGLSPEKAAARTAEYKARLETAINRGLGNIAKVHRLDTGEIKIVGMDKAALADARQPADLLGFYSLDSDSITLNLDGGGSDASRAETLTHEMGHLLDHRGVIPVGDALKGGENRVRIASAWNGSQAQRWTAMEGNMARYLSSPPEIMARAYSQYVAEEAGDFDIQLIHQEEVGHWTGDDFEPMRQFVVNALGDKVTKRYNPAQPRDARGRWSDGFGTGPQGRALRVIIDRDIARAAEAFGVPEKELRAGAREGIRRFVAEAKVEVRVSRFAFDRIKQSGRIGTAREFGSRSDEYMEHRLNLEAEMFGPDANPVYGALVGKFGARRDLDQYGEIALTLKDSVKAKATMTDGDSFPTPGFDGTYAPQHRVPSPVSAPSEYSINWYNGVRPRGSVADSVYEHLSDGGKSGYIEVQIHDTVTWDDVETIVDVSRDVYIEKYNPNQPRDNRGRWSSGGGGATLTAGHPLSGKYNPRQGDDQGRSDRAALEIAARMLSEGIVTREDVNLAAQAASLVGSGGGGPVRDDKIIPADTVYAEGRERIAAYPEATHVYFNGAGFSCEEGQRYTGVPIDREDPDQSMLEAQTAYAVREMQSAWGSSSNKGVMYAVQEQAQNQFPMEYEASIMTDSDEYEAYGYYGPDFSNFTSEYLKAQYDHTQSILARDGITAIEVFRGMQFDSSEESVWPGETNFALRPMSAFSTDLEDAKWFAEHGDMFHTSEGDQGMVFSTTVPADRVLSVAGEGLGWGSLGEVVVLGGEMPGMMTEVGRGSADLYKARAQSVTETTPMADWLQAVRRREAPFEKYNPNQPRDDHGKWTSGGGGLTGVAGAERLDRAAFLSNLPGEDFHGNRAIARNISADKSISTLDALIVAEAGREPHADIEARHEIAMDKARDIGAASIAHSGPMTFRRSWGASILPEFPTAETPADQIAKTPDEIDAAIRNVVIEDATRALSQAWNTRANGHLALFVQDAIAKKRPGAATLEDIYGEGSARYIRQGTEFMDSPSMRRFADAYAQGVYETTQAQLRELGVSSVAVARGMKIEPDMPQPPLGESVNVRLRPMSSFSTDVQKAFHFAATQGGGTANGYIQKMDVKAEDIWSVGGLGPGALEEREVIVLDNGSNTSLVEGGYVMEKAATPAVVEAVGNLWPVDPIDAWLGEQIEKRYNPSQPRDNKGRWTDGLSSPGAFTPDPDKGLTATVGDWQVFQPYDKWDREGKSPGDYSGELKRAAEEMQSALKAAGVPVAPMTVIGYPHGPNDGYGAEDAWTFGWYNPADRPGAITLNQENRTSAFFGVHEYAHLLDYEFFGAGPKRAGTSMQVDELKGVLGAIKNSVEAKSWYDDPYFGARHEEFARAFAQYVAVKSGDFRMGVEVEKQRSVQWSAHSFAPIMAEFDALFATVEKRYNPGQPRDSRGRWTDGFGGAYLDGLSPESLPYGEHPGVKEVQRMKERMEDGAWEAQAAIEEHGYLMVNEAFEDEWQENPGLEDLTKAQVLTGSIEALYEAQFSESEAGADLVRDTVREELQAYVDGGTVAVRAEPDAAVMILRDQRFRTQHETNTSNGHNNPGLRAKFEEGAFGYPADLDPAMRPVYGYIAPPNERIYDGPYQYGNVRFNLKPETKSRSTVTMGDSLKMNADYAHPSPATEVSHLSVNPYNAIHVGGGESLGLDDFSRSNYVEAQIHGGIHASDIASIDILGGTKFANEQPFWDELYAQAESLGIPVKVVE